MPRYLVTFPHPVVYLQGHPKGQRTLTELLVQAPSPRGALLHAVRVCAGDVGEPIVTEAAAKDLTPVEANG